MTPQEAKEILLRAALRNRSVTGLAHDLAISRPTVSAWAYTSSIPSRPNARKLMSLTGISLPLVLFGKPDTSRGCRSAIPIVREMFAEADARGLLNKEIATAAKVDPKVVTNLRKGSNYPVFSTIEAVADALGFRVVLEKK